MQFLSISQRRKGFVEGDYASFSRGGDGACPRAVLRRIHSPDLASPGYARRMLVMGGKWRRAGSRNVGYIPVCPGRYDGDVTGSARTLCRLQTNKASWDPDVISC